MGGSGISWAICKYALRSRQITMPAPNHSVLYRLDALPAAQPTASKHWRHCPGRRGHFMGVFVVLHSSRQHSLHLSHWASFLLCIWEVHSVDITQRFAVEAWWSDLVWCRRTAWCMCCTAADAALANQGQDALQFRLFCCYAYICMHVCVYIIMYDVCKICL